MSSYISYRLHFLWGATHHGREMHFHSMWLEGLILTTPDLKTVEGPVFFSEFQAMMKQFWLSLYSLKVPLSPGNLLFYYAFWVVSHLPAA